MGRKRKKKTPGKKTATRKVVDSKTTTEELDEPAGAHKSTDKPTRAATEGRAEALEDDTSPVWTMLLTGLLIFLISTPPIIGPYGQKGGYTPDLHMAAYIQVGGLVILSLFLVSCFSRMRIVIPRSPILVPILIFYAWAMLSILWADNKYNAVVDGLDWSGAFLAAALVVLLLRRVAVLNVMLFFLLISGLLMALLGMVQYLIGIDWVQQHVVPAATFSNKNMAGQYGVLTFPIAAAFFLHSRDKAKIWLFAVIMAIIMTYVFYTRSRGAWVSLLTELIVLCGILAYLKLRHDFHIFSNMPSKKVALVVAVALFVGLSSLTPKMFGNAGRVTDTSIGSKPGILWASHGGKVLKEVADFSGSARTRTTMWMNSIPMFREHFLVGVGLGNWTKHYGAYQNWFKPDRALLKNLYHANAHNDYVEILCELGIIGFALFLWTVVALFRVIGRLLISHDRDYYLLAMSLTVAIMGIAINAVFSFPLKQPVPIFLVLIYIAVLSNLYGARFETGREFVLRRFPVPFKGVAVGVAVIAGISMFFLQHNWYKSELHYRNAVVSMKQGNYRRTQTEARSAHELNPLRSELLWLEATALFQIGRGTSNDKVIAMLERVDRDRPYLPHSINNLASAYVRSGRYNDAAEAMGRLLEVQPDGPKKRYKYGVFLFNAGRFEEAIENLEKVDLYGKWSGYKRVKSNIEKITKEARARIERKGTAGTTGGSRPVAGAAGQ